MKNYKLLTLVGFSLGVITYCLYRRQRIKTEILAWQENRSTALNFLACPKCLGTLIISPLPARKGYYCTECQKYYPVINGIAQFTQPDQINGMNKAFSKMYDWFSWFYRPFSKVAFAYIGMPEEQARREVTDRLDPQGGPILEVSIGPGVNLPYLVGRSDVGEIYGLDISQGQLNRCREYVAQREWNVNLNLGNAERLPFQNNVFAGVFHIGGINFFNDKKAAIQEMVRVAKPGARILIADETEKGAQGYEKFIPGFKNYAGRKRDVIQPPINLVPPEMREQRVFDIWKGWLYCIEFNKPFAEKSS